MDKKNQRLILSILGILSVILITAGVTYAFFNYAKEGTTENSLTTGTITFLYNEISGVGRGISLEDAYPVSDSVGKAQTGSGKVFDFKVTSNTPNQAAIDYEVTARLKDTSTVPEDKVKLYLTKVEGTTEEEVILSKYSELTPTTKVDSSKYNEKTLYLGKVPYNTSDYEQAFRLRMWIDEETDFSDGSMNDKEFTVTVNVYANAKVVSAEEINYESSTEISNISSSGTSLTAVEGKDYHYATVLPEGTTSTDITIETENPNATVSIEKVDSLAYSNKASVKRLSTTKTLELTNGDNYFKVTIISENKQVEDEYIVKISVPIKLSQTIFTKYSVIDATPTLTTSSNNTTDASGLYKSTLTNSGDPTYYFRGNVENYVDFAGFTWRVVRINEDGTIRIVLQDGINDNATYKFNPKASGYTYMYYSNSNVENGAKYILDNWYTTNITSNENYLNRVATGEYYCEEAKVKYSSSYTSGSATMMVYNDTTYTPTFSCSEDGNTKGIVNASIGLLTYDEVLHAGGYFGKSNNNYYLYNSAIKWWTMSPAGVSSTNLASAWTVTTTGYLYNNYVSNSLALRPVLNLKADTAVTGLGTSDSHWIVAN